MTQEINQNCEALLEWAKQDKENRAIIVIGYERGEVTEDDIMANAVLAQGGSRKNLVAAVKAALPQNGKSLANIIKQATHELFVEELIDDLMKDKPNTDNTEKTAEK